MLSSFALRLQDAIRSGVCTILGSETLTDSQLERLHLPAGEGGASLIGVLPIMHAAFVASASAVDKWYDICKDTWGDARVLRATLRGRAELLLSINYINHELAGHRHIRFEAIDVARLHQAPVQSKIDLEVPPPH